MVGDIMQHGMQLRASTQDDGTTSWRGVFDPVAPVLSAADLALGNLETPVDTDQDFAGYPLFNAPESLLDALVDAGFDGLQTANNHSLDRDRAGALATLEAVRERGMATVGTFASADERDRPWATFALPGPVEVAFLAYSYGTNGRPLPDGEPWLVNLLDAGQMQDDIARARAAADVVIVGIHWGREYQHAPEPWQRDLAWSLVDAGADIVMGSHPHVLQPAEVGSVMRAEGPRDALVLYSLGNFVSNQRTPNRDVGVIARATIATCVETGAHHVVDVRFTPTWVDTRLSDGTLAYRVLPLPPEDAACPVGLDLSEADCRRMATARAHTATLLPAGRFDGEAGLPAPFSAPSWPMPFLPPHPEDGWAIAPPPTGDSVSGAPSPRAVLWPPPGLARTQRDGGVAVPEAVAASEPGG
jgi:poly-gamma-glutamate synthesis protein (capsule biosynthesis protein)